MQVDYSRLLVNPDQPAADIVKDNSQDIWQPKIKYFVRSRRFNRFYKAGTEIRDDNPLLEAWETDERLQTELRASDFGSRSGQIYSAECVQLAQSEKLLVLLSQEDKQQRLHFAL